jgi:hypothetical protein
MLTKNPTKLNCKIGTQTSIAAFFTAMEIFMSLAQYKNYSQGSCTWLWHALISWLLEKLLTPRGVSSHSSFLEPLSSLEMDWSSK